MGPQKYEICPNAAKIAVLFSEKSLKLFSFWVLSPLTPLFDKRELQQFAQHVAQLLRHFSGKVNLWYFSVVALHYPLPGTKFCLSDWPSNMLNGVVVLHYGY